MFSAAFGQFLRWNKTLQTHNTYFFLHLMKTFTLYMLTNTCVVFFLSFSILSFTHTPTQITWHMCLTISCFVKNVISCVCLIFDGSEQQNTCFHRRIETSYNTRRVFWVDMNSFPVCFMLSLRFLHSPLFNVRLSYLQPLHVVSLPPSPCNIRVRSTWTQHCFPLWSTCVFLKKMKASLYTPTEY